MFDTYTMLELLLTNVHSTNVKGQFSSSVLQQLTVKHPEVPDTIQVSTVLTDPVSSHIPNQINHSATAPTQGIQ